MLILMTRIRLLMKPMLKERPAHSMHQVVIFTRVQSAVIYNSATVCSARALNRQSRFVANPSRVRLLLRKILAE